MGDGQERNEQVDIHCHNEGRGVRDNIRGEFQEYVEKSSIKVDFLRIWCIVMQKTIARFFIFHGQRSFEYEVVTPERID